MVRDLIGSDVALSVDANQSWDVNEAIDAIRRLAPFNPHWVEEPTSPDDVLGHIADHERGQRPCASPPASTSPTA